VSTDGTAEVSGHDKEETLVAALLLISASAGLLLLHGSARWMFGVLVAVLWVRFIGSRLLRARRRWLALEEAGFPPENEVSEAQLRGLSRRRLLISGLEITGLALLFMYATAVGTAKILRNGLTGNHFLGFTVSALGVFVFGRIAAIWWATFIDSPTDTDEVLRRRLRAARPFKPRSDPDAPASR
jgi:MFS family permease